MDVYIRGKKVRLDPARSIGKGGEADIYDIGSGLAAKVFKEPTHPDYAGQSVEQQGARERIATHQKKLPAFPKNLPARVVAPVDLLTDRAGNRIVGYTMPIVENAEVLLRYADRGFRAGRIENDTVIPIFRDLWSTVSGIHGASVVIGDFNDLNILVHGAEAQVIDADSFQFANFPCRVFTAKFVDPLLCDPRASSLMLVRPHHQNSDWYAFVVMLMNSLLYVHPYGGVYQPKDPKRRVNHDARPLHRITVFHPEVRYPKPAISYGVLPDDLLHYFHQVFEKDERGIFPVRLLEVMRWTKCTNCGIKHGRATCPSCQQAAPAAVREVVRVRGKVTATRIFRTTGEIVTARIQGGKLCFLYHEALAWRREDRTVVLHGPFDPKIQTRIQGAKTLMGRDGRLVTVDSDKPPETVTVDSCGTLPVFDANTTSKYWVANGQLFRDGLIGGDYIGDVLLGQTRFWVGEAFGFGFYRAGSLSIAFVFGAGSRGIKDTVKLEIRGQLIDATCVFGHELAWFFSSTHERGKQVNRGTLIDARGTVLATAEANAGDGSWLGVIHGKCAVGKFLLAATDDGVVRVEQDGNALRVTKEFLDTEPFVDASSRLLAGKEGLYVVSEQEIVLLKLQ